MQQECLVEQKNLFFILLTNCLQKQSTYKEQEQSNNQMSICFLLHFLIQLLLVISQKIGNEVLCSKQGDCNSDKCGVFPGAVWQDGLQEGFCAIQDCSVAQLPSSDLNDSICGSCPPNLGAIYASSDRKNCVASTQSCSSNSNFSDNICQICNPSKQYASSDKTQCVASSHPCNVTSGWNDSNCSLCIPTKPYASLDGKTCVASTIPCNSTSGWTDSNCSQCYPLKPYASLDGKSCVNSTISCKSQSGWTDYNCAICYPTKKYASLDQTTCISSSQSCTSPTNMTDSDCLLCNPTTPYANILQIYCVASSVSCINRNPNMANQKWTDSDCQACYSVGYRAQLNGSACVNCNASLGLSNADCSLCNGQGIGTNQYANYLGSCVPVNCSKTSGWVDSDCEVCNSTTPTASSDGTICLNTTYSALLFIHIINFIFLLNV
ncbi:cell surface immobilization antigen (macronuclear) [Tetrahymena thermophila SB210]|uniref:Cell surface immobilization antigen n=1 Tax=Tetrahymena thermophila (strain SB210) TaxID=312017 RepID=Q22TI2_TETTS|nr:cell surface immobilization antigen [Tetrahymena thermophila SB210]EAR88456.2 cell surface immobilization antigen [Tetrahymena thermophila SB210]|eukprot:XP_001008701.2 cell surface immobilization antigen [Tetrahymena thermophila SB210]